MVEYNVVDMGAAFPHRINVKANDPLQAVKKIFPEISVKKDRMGDLIVMSENGSEVHFSQTGEGCFAFAKIMSDIAVKGGFTRKEIASRIGTCPETVGRWMSGKRFPRDEMVDRISSAFGIEKSKMLKALGR